MHEHVTPLQNRMHKTDAGVSLVELLVGLAVGLFLVAAAALLLSNQLDDNRRLALETQLQQDLRAASDIVARDLRRAGYWGGAEQALSDPAGARADNPYIGTSDLPTGRPLGLLTYAYSLDERQSPHMAENDTLDSHDQSGFRLRSGAIDLLLGSGNWQQVTDPGTLKVTRFEITAQVQRIELGGHCHKPCPPEGVNCPPWQELRTFDIVIAGQAAHDPAVRRSMTSTVRARNDAIHGRCPA